jgi:hypothetical protein
VTSDVGRRESAPRFVIYSQHRTREFEQDFSVMGQAGLAPVVFEQGAADQVFEAPDLMGDRRLRPAHLPAGGRQPSCIDNGDESPEQRNIQILAQCFQLNDKSRE